MSVYLKRADFLEFVSENFGTDGQGLLFAPEDSECFDLIIANPPYVRTQIMGSHQAQHISQRFGLSGRVDLYHAFILAMIRGPKARGLRGNHSFKPFHVHSFRCARFVVR